VCTFVPPASPTKSTVNHDFARRDSDGPSPGLIRFISALRTGGTCAASANEGTATAPPTVIRSVLRPA
jgi:hypothetical protein